LKALRKDPPPSKKAVLLVREKVKRGGLVRGQKRGKPGRGHQTIKRGGGCPLRICRMPVVERGSMSVGEGGDIQQEKRPPYPIGDID